MISTEVIQKIKVQWVALLMTGSKHDTQQNCYAPCCQKCCYDFTSSFNLIQLLVKHKIKWPITVLGIEIKLETVLSSQRVAGDRDDIFCSWDFYTILDNLLCMTEHTGLSIARADEYLYFRMALRTGENSWLRILQWRCPCILQPSLPTSYSLLRGVFKQRIKIIKNFQSTK